MELVMTAGEYCNRNVVVIDKSESVREAVRLMRSRHVGDVVVIERRSQRVIPRGILTDRDIVVEIVAKDVDLDLVNVGDVMSDQLVTVDSETKLLDAIKLMRIKGVRRLPVVNAGGELQGILTVDDFLELIVEQLSDITGIVSNEMKGEIKKRH